MSRLNNNYQKLSSMQVKSIQAMFKYYDVDAKGKIPRERAFKLLQTLGVDTSYIASLHTEVSAKHLIQYVDDHLPEPEPPLSSELNSFVKLVAHNEIDATNENSANSHSNSNLVISPQDIIDFFQSTDQIIPNGADVIERLIGSMAEWDDCSDIPKIPAAVFTREVTKFAKKTNALKDFVN